jgi:multimeric flavodoxin WrbA
MTKKTKILFVSGSPRNGNTNFILEKVIEKLDKQSTELILLKNYEIKSCKGCMYCHSKPKCTTPKTFECFSVK